MSEADQKLKLRTGKWFNDNDASHADTRSLFLNIAAAFDAR